MNKEFIKSIRYYLIAFVFLFLLSIIFSLFASEFVLEIDNTVSSFLSTYVVRDSFTSFFKVVTNMGSVYFYVALIILFIIVLKNKKIPLLMSVNLAFAYLLNNVIKITLRRERPLINLIEKPSGYSFPSGHAMCSVAFYGLLIYIINKKIKSKSLKPFLNILLTIIVLLIVFSRIYLNVHYFADIIFGSIFGFLALKITIEYDKLYSVIGEEK